MKINPWTVGLAAAGVVSLGSVVQAEEQQNHILTALSSTTLSGYVNASAHWNVNPGTRNNRPGYSFNGTGAVGKNDGFNLDVVDLRFEKPLDESDWAAGYLVNLWFGTDANTLGTQSLGATSDFAIRQAYVALRAPVGNGLDFKVGVFDTIIGYESFDAGNNPNYTRSYGHSIEPTQHTGVLATYRLTDYLAASFGVANTTSAAINGRHLGTSAAFPTDSYKTYMASVAVTAPEDSGWLKGSTLYAGVVNGAPAGIAPHQANYYVGATLATPVEGLSLGAAFDLLDIRREVAIGGIGASDSYAAALYASFKATEKLSLHGRGEYFVRETVGDNNNELWALTGTVQYDLWDNVLSRLELRYDFSPDGVEFHGLAPGAPGKHHALLIAANIIYKF